MFNLQKLTYILLIVLFLLTLSSLTYYLLGFNKSVLDNTLNLILPSTKKYTFNVYSEPPFQEVSIKNTKPLENIIKSSKHPLQTVDIHFVSNESTENSKLYLNNKVVGSYSYALDQTGRKMDINIYIQNEILNDKEKSSNLVSYFVLSAITEVPEIQSSFTKIDYFNFLNKKEYHNMFVYK